MVKLWIKSNKGKNLEDLSEVWVRYGGGSVPNTWRSAKIIGWAGARFDNLKIWSVDKKIEQIWYLDLVSGASETRPVE